MKHERVVIVGGGIGGLATALALEGSGRDVLIIERDPPPPEIAPSDAFERWDRPGVPQFRHAHIFLARLRTLLRDRHPALLAELMDAGFTDSALDEILPPSQLAIYEPSPGDGELLHLWGRRATFEYVLRRHVGRLAHVAFMHDTRVEGLSLDASGRALHVRGVQVVRTGTRETISADIVVDASGKRGQALEWLADSGVAIGVDAYPSEYTYVCRHYRLRESGKWPARRGTGANLDYIWYGTFYAEQDRFAIAFACPTEEQLVAKALANVDQFQAACASIPVLERWTAAAEPTTKVLGAGRFENKWIDYGVRGRALLGFFPVGDAHFQTNPMYGRGCASAFVQAELLAEALGHSGDPARRARWYRARTRALLRPHFDTCVGGDRMFLHRARRSFGRPGRLPDRAIQHLYERAYTPALHESPLVARELIKAMEMRELSHPFVRIAVLLRIIGSWVRGWLSRPKWLPAVEAPTRDELMRSLSTQREPGQRHDDSEAESRSA